MAGSSSFNGFSRVSLVLSRVVRGLERDTLMLFAFGPEDLERYAIPIGIGIALLVILIVPSLRRSILDSYKKGKEARERLTRRNKPGEDKAEETGGK
jgi:hypothetical protein